nr:early nodulin-20-like [Aegilops tauschii subsp. strangulata]
MEAGKARRLEAGALQGRLAGGRKATTDDLAASSPHPRPQPPSSRIPAPLAPALSPTSPSTRPCSPAHFATTNAPQTSPPPTPLRPRRRGPLSSSPSHHAARSLDLSSSEGKGREEKRESEQVHGRVPAPLVDKVGSDLDE